MGESATGFGGQLRSERERRGISLETLCAQTKVNSRHITALEGGDFQALPGGVFRRGIVRAYLAAIGLDEQGWMPRFEASFTAEKQSLGPDGKTGEEAWATFAENVRRGRDAPHPRTRLRWLGVLAMLLILAAAGWAVWHFVAARRLV